MGGAVVAYLSYSYRDTKLYSTAECNFLEFSNTTCNSCSIGHILIDVA